MAPARDPWWIIGSAAVALHGADPGEIRDIDIVLSVGDAFRILPDIHVPLAPGRGDGLFRSKIYNRWTKPEIPAEFMAGFELMRDGDWAPVRFDSREEVLPGIFVPSKAELLALLMDFGRPKDIARADSLRSA